MNIQIEYFDEIASTNDYVREKRGDGRDLIVLAKRQSGGKGTKGRSFSSEIGGVYLTKLSFYQGFAAKDAFRIMQGAAAAVCLTLESYGLQPKIKWPNDVYVGGKKICGILIENGFSGAEIAYSIVGIGINVYNPLPEELREIATSIFLQTGEKVSVDEVAKRLIAHLSEDRVWERYAQYLGWMGENVTLCVDGKEREVTLLSVDETGGLWAQTADGKQRFVAAEVRLKVQ